VNEIWSTATLSPKRLVSASTAMMVFWDEACIAANMAVRACNG
jgi:hypothetical protein